MAVARQHECHAAAEAGRTSKCLACMFGIETEISRPLGTRLSGSSLGLSERCLRPDPSTPRSTQESLHESRIARIAVCCAGGATGRLGRRCGANAKCDCRTHPLPAENRTYSHGWSGPMRGLPYAAIALWFCAICGMHAYAGEPASPSPKRAAIMDFELINEMRDYETAESRAAQQQRLPLIDDA